MEQTNKSDVPTPGGLEGLPRRLNRRFARDWLSYALAALILGGYIGQNLYTDYHRVGDEERARLLGQARVVDENLGRQLLAVDRALASVRDDLPMLREQPSGRYFIDRRLQSVSDATPGIRTITVLDADGIATDSNRDDVIGKNFHEREYFKLARRDRKPAELFVSPPFKTALGIYTLPVVKVLLDDRGGFAGVILAFLDPGYFGTLLESVRYAPDMLVSLVHGDGKVIFRVPNPEGVVGLDVAIPGTFFTRHMSSGRASSAFDGTPYASGEKRLVVLHTIRPAAVHMDKPLVIVLSRKRSAVYASWRKRVYEQGGLFGLLLLSTSVSLFFYQRRRRAFEQMAAALDIAAAVENERKRSGEALARESHRNEVFLRSASDGVHILDADGKVLEVSDSFCEMLGYPREALLGAYASLWAVQWSAQELKQIISEQLFKGVRSELETTYRRRDGSILNVEVTAHGLELDGKPVVFNSARDVTERVRAQAELRTLFQAVEQSPASIVITDPAGRIEYVNPHFELATGYTKAEAIGANPRIVRSGLVPKEIYAQLWAAISAGGEWRGELCNRRKNGELFWEFAAISGVRGASGAIEHYVAVKEDITERKRLEEIHTQSEKMEALGTLAGGVAHDFNNIIASIMGNVELACQDVGPGHPAQQSLEEIRKASSRAKNLVQQILAFGRRQVIERKVISLAPVVQEAVNLLRATLPAGVGLHAQCAPDAPGVLADATRIEQVVLNLCSNAAHAIQSQERAGTIEVRLEARFQPDATAPQEQWTHVLGELPPGPYARLTVRDNGPGMDEATLERIFEPFFTTKEVGKGTGLGLSVVHGIAQEHGASIKVRSIAGEGTTFVIDFPAADAPVSPAPGQDRRPARSRDGEAAVSRGEGKRVLYIDDDESIVLLMTRLLGRQGYRVSGYTDSGKALEAARIDPGQFDLVVTDYNMPGMSGLEVASALREIRADLPVAMASGYITEELRQKAPAAGVRELIYKPNTVEELCEAVSRLAKMPNGGGSSS